MWRPTADVEWPGHRGVSIDLWGCSLRCPYCATGAIRGPVPSVVDWREIVDAIVDDPEAIDGVVVTGGEPTEDPDLPSLLAALCEFGVHVRLETNGTRPDVLAFLAAEQLCHSLALDVKTVPARYRQITSERDAAARVAESVDVVIDSWDDHEFRTTFDPSLVAFDELPRIARILRGGRLFAIQACHPIGGHPSEPLEVDRLRSAAVECCRFIDTVVRPTGIEGC